MRLGRGHTIQHIIEQVKAYVFPVFCLGCGREEAYICESCKDQLSFAPAYEHGSGDLQSLLYLGLFSRTRLLGRVIELWKYGFVESIPQYFEPAIKDCISSYQDFFSSIDYIVPVPLHARRYAERGFNQSKVLSSMISNHTKVEVIHVLKRSIYTRQQATLNRKERLQNVQHSFVYDGKLNMEGVHILLVDDVYTTGSTIQACAAKLQQHGATRISAFVIARTIDGGDECV